MNHMKQITFLTAILLAFSACELRVEGTPFYKGQQVSLSATVPSNGGGGSSNYLINRELQE